MEYSISSHYPAVPIFIILPVFLFFLNIPVFSLVTQGKLSIYPPHSACQCPVFSAIIRGEKQVMIVLQSVKDALY
jgi:hypothetical protein